MSHSPSVPELLPVLSRGKHRSPRRGACFMELTSFLAGERWSDHPRCTHELLAEVARNVNDRTTDAGRPQLAPLIPSVIGLTTDDPRADVRIALHCALAALPVVAFEAQRSLAVGALASDRQLAALGDPDTSELRRRMREVLADVPDAAGWAAAFTARQGLQPEATSLKRFRRHAAPGIVKAAARGIAVAVIPSPDDRLRSMLEGAIEQCRRLSTAAVPEQVDTSRWQEVVALTR